MSETHVVETADPEEAFTALADDTRIDILGALWDAEDHTATFSELREAIGMRDSGQFNYHLDKLRGRFVRKTDDGYELTLAGRQVNGSIHAGGFTMEGAIEPIHLEDTCPACGGDRRLTYEDEEVLIECADCSLIAKAGVPPGVFATYDRDAVPAVASRYFRTILQHLRNGFCWFCDGQATPTVVPIGETVYTEGGVPERFQNLPMVEYVCKRCGADMTTDIGTAVLDHPAVISFHYERGVNVRDRPFWEFGSWDSETAWIESKDPIRARIGFAVDGDELVLHVDEDGEILDIEEPDVN